RRDHFDKKCIGMTWRPVYQAPASGSANAQRGRPARTSQTSPTTSGTSSTSSTDFIDLERINRDREIRTVLDDLVVESFDLVGDLDTETARLANAIMGDIETCGFSYLGPKCVS